MPRISGEPRAPTPAELPPMLVIPPADAGHHLNPQQQTFWEEARRHPCSHATACSARRALPSTDGALAPPRPADGARPLQEGRRAAAASSAVTARAARPGGRDMWCARFRQVGAAARVRDDVRPAAADRRHAARRAGRLGHPGRHRGHGERGAAVDDDVQATAQCRPQQGARGGRGAAVFGPPAHVPLHVAA
eukprot:5883789-Prymnesium_polylepis.1